MLGVVVEKGVEVADVEAREDEDGGRVQHGEANETGRFALPRAPGERERCLVIVVDVLVATGGAVVDVPVEAPEARLFSPEAVKEDSVNQPLAKVGVDDRRRETDDLEPDPHVHPPTKTVTVQSQHEMTK